MPARIICRAISGKKKDEDALGDGRAFAGSGKIAAVARGEYRGRSRGDIRGSGYVVDCLEEAMWGFVHTDGFAEAVLISADPGDDADTAAAVRGQVAGAYCGGRRIPALWIERLSFCSDITKPADRLYSLGKEGTS